MNSALFAMENQLPPKKQASTKKRNSNLKLLKTIHGMNIPVALFLDDNTPIRTIEVTNFADNVGLLLFYQLEDVVDFIFKKIHRSVQCIFVDFLNVQQDLSAMFTLLTS